MQRIPARTARTMTPTRPWLRTTSGLAIPGIIACLLVAPSQGAQMTVQPTISISVSHNDNTRLEEDGPEQSATRGALGLAANFRWKTELTEVMLRPRANLGRYPDSEDERLEYDDLFLDFSVKHRSQKSTLSIDANISEQNVLRGEVESPEFDDTGVGDALVGTGNIRQNQDRTLVRVRPAASYSFSQRVDGIVDLSYIDVSYDPQVSGASVGYDDAQVGAALAYKLSTESTFSFRVYAGEFEAGGSLNESSSVGAAARYQVAASERSSVFVEVGYQDTDITSGSVTPVNTSESTFSWNVGANRRWANSQLRVVAGQSVRPSGSGSLTERQQIRMSLRHQMSERWSLEFGAVAVKTDRLATDSSVGDRDYVQGKVALEYKLSPKWSLRGSASFTRQDDADTPGEANATQAGVSIVFRPPVQNR